MKLHEIRTLIDISYLKYRKKCARDDTFPKPKKVWEQDLVKIIERLPEVKS